MVPTMSRIPINANRDAAVVIGIPWSCDAGTKCVPIRPLVLAPQIAKVPARSQNTLVFDAITSTEIARPPAPPRW